MKRIALFALFASACTFTPGDDLTHTKLHSPFAYQTWKTEKSTSTDGSKSCVLDSGYNGLRVTLSKAGVSANSTRPMDIGTMFTITTSSGGYFETSDASFPPDIAKAMVENFRQGGKAWLEWSEVHGHVSTRTHIQQSALLDHFATQMDECERWLSRP